MPAISEAKSLTVRISPEVYEASRQIAQKRHVSLNALVQQSLQAVIRAEEEKADYDSYTLLGQDREMCDVEWAFAAQAEVVLRDEP